MPPGRPSSRASTLDVPPGHTASGVDVPTMTCMASFTVPSPPWTMIRSVRASSAAAVSRVASAGPVVTCGVTVMPRPRSASTMRVIEWKRSRRWPEPGLWTRTAERDTAPR